MAPPRQVFPITFITGIVRHDEGESILVPRHPDAQSMPNVEDEFILIRSGVESLPTLSRRDDVPRINGSEGAFIAVVIILSLIFLTSTTAIFILLRNHDPTPAERASRRRAHPSIRRPGVPHSLPIGLSHDRTLTDTGEDYTYTERHEQGYGHGHVRDPEGSYGGSFTEKLGNMFRSVGLGGRRTGSGWGRVNADQDWDSGDEDMDMLQRQQQDNNHLHPQYQYNPHPQPQPQRPYPTRQKSDQVEINGAQPAQHPEFISDDDRTTHHHHVGRSASHVTPTEAYGVRNLDLDLESMPSTRASTPGFAGSTPGLSGSALGYTGYAGRTEKERERDSTQLTSPSVYSTWSYRDPFDTSSHPAPGPSLEGHSFSTHSLHHDSPVDMHASQAVQGHIPEQPTHGYGAPPSGTRGVGSGDSGQGQGGTAGNTKHDRQRSDDSHFSETTFAGGSKFNEHIEFD